MRHNVCKSSMPIIEFHTVTQALDDLGRDLSMQSHQILTINAA